MRAFEIRHTVGFEETNLVGNVYYANHVRWQGRCREMFLRQHAPGIAELLRQGLALATVRCSCEFYNELEAFDEVAIRMRLAALSASRMTLQFEYWRIGAVPASRQEELVARGEQEVACLRRDSTGTRVAAWPADLLSALEPFATPDLITGARV